MSGLIYQFRAVFLKHGHERNVVPSTAAAYT
jgi:hypothetical protein